MTPLLAQRPRSDRAFERLYKRHVGDVYRYALAVMRNPADAEDVTQTTFLNAYRSYVEKGNRPEKPQNWLIAIAHNVCRQRFRQSARRPAEVSFEDDIADTLVDDEAPSGEDIRRALSHLAFNQRAALVMRELEGRSYAEIAEILDLSTSAVETLIFRARRALRERKDCAAFARRQRAQRGALKTLALVPVPSSLSSFFGGGAAVGTGLALKAAAAVSVGLVVGGASYEGVTHAPWKAPATATSAPVAQSVSPTAFVPAPREHIPFTSSAHVQSGSGTHHAAATKRAHGHG